MIRAHRCSEYGSGAGEKGTSWLSTPCQCHAASGRCLSVPMGPSCCICSSIRLVAGHAPNPASCACRLCHHQPKPPPAVYGTVPCPHSIVCSPSTSQLAATMASQPRQYASYGRWWWCLSWSDCATRLAELQPRSACAHPELPWPRVGSPPRPVPAAAIWFEIIHLYFPRPPLRCSLHLPVWWPGFYQCPPEARPGVLPLDSAGESPVPLGLAHGSSFDLSESPRWLALRQARTLSA